MKSRKSIKGQYRSKKSEQQIEKSNNRTDINPTTSIIILIINDLNTQLKNRLLERIKKI